MGGEFLAWLAIYSLYVGVIVLIYGNLVSVGLEYLQKAWFKNHIWLYVLLHAFFGLANGLIFQELGFAIAGMVVAFVYALIDRWLYVREKVQKSIKLFFILPILTCGLLWGYFEMISKPLPPFTMEDAVEFATAPDGTVTDVFPKEIGKWAGVIEGYHVERETTAIEVGKETYIITFTEKWSKEKEEGSRFLSYEIERGSSTYYNGDGDEPPYNQ